MVCLYIPEIEIQFWLTLWKEWNGRHLPSPPFLICLKGLQYLFHSRVLPDMKVEYAGFEQQTYMVEEDIPVLER